MTLSAEAAEFAGVTQPIKDATLSASVAGQVKTIHVEEGDRVEANGVLIELDKEMEKLEAVRRKLVMDSKTELEAAGQRLNMVKKDLSSTRRLFEGTKSVSEEEMMQKELEHKLAEAEFAQLQQAEKREKIEYMMAMEQLKRREIRAPMAGTVTEIFLEEGENCEKNQPLVRVVDTASLRFVTNVPSERSQDLRVGLPARLQVGEASLEGKLSFVSPVIDPASGLREVKAEFENAGGRVAPGVTATLVVEEE
jgi:RND family efflux transporter MFP subunit